MINESTSSTRNQKQFQAFMQTKPYKTYFFKFLLILLLSTGFGLYRFLYDMDFTNECIFDLSHDLLYPFNRMIDNDPNLVILLIGQIIMDLFVFFMMAFWYIFQIIKLRNIRFPMMIIVFFGIRAFFLFNEKFPFPDLLAWRAPNFPTVMVPYDHTRDFFYSGHTGMALLIIIQLTIVNQPIWLLTIGYIGLSYTIFMLLSSRVHYCIDVIGSFIFVTISVPITIKTLYWAEHFWSLPFAIAMKIKQKCCGGRNSNEDNSLVDDKI